ncbi:MAG TPA: hypothetical protein VHQ93_20250 [Chitinophagaceae bacterium]|jgi:hypothetical protein|nr:hypothetical protein [Chitinophagaceae bacterium]
MKKLFIVLAIATAFASCNDEKKESTTETSAPATTEVAPPTETAPVATDAPTTTATSN